ncbi:MAG: S8 family peptidase [Candidatus Azobacteroides sp.]|nr:S8 family peptidase [Candidatus Azobacteroides sp.]
MYRLTLYDKGDTYSAWEPEKFLSRKSIERRRKQGFVVDETDLPIDSRYFDALRNLGAEVRAYSKWVKTIVVNVPDSSVLQKINELPFVKKAAKVWKGDLSIERNERRKKSEGRESGGENEGQYWVSGRFDPDNYGEALTQIEINNALILHEKGYKGKGISIAALDGGFTGVSKYPAFFDPDKIVEVRNFTHEKGNFYEGEGLEDHGTRVLSCMLANNPGKMIGTAPLANYYLFKTEVKGDEYPVEEDYWIAALEYADSLGVDIVTSSLGYSKFDDPQMSHNWEDLDGYSTTISRAASMAAFKGMVILSSAGNEGNKNWQKVNIPSDAQNILSVGAVKNDSTLAPFSSWGYLINGRIKPDVMAMGYGCEAVSSSGNLTYSDGSSFSTPIMAGMVACLWEALPQLSSLELMNLVKESSDRFFHPDEYFGYGIPDIYKAYLKGKKQSYWAENMLPSMKDDPYEDSIYRNGRLYFKSIPTNPVAQLSIYSGEGELVYKQILLTDSVDVDFLQKGAYIACLQSGTNQQVWKFVK